MRPISPLYICQRETYFFQKRPTYVKRETDMCQNRPAYVKCNQKGGNNLFFSFAIKKGKTNILRTRQKNESNQKGENGAF